MMNVNQAPLIDITDSNSAEEHITRALNRQTNAIERFTEKFTLLIIVVAVCWVLELIFNAVQFGVKTGN